MGLCRAANLVSHLVVRAGTVSVTVITAGQINPYTSACAVLVTGLMNLRPSFKQRGEEETNGRVDSGGGLSGVKRNEFNTCCEMSFPELVVKTSFKIGKKTLALNSISVHHLRFVIGNPTVFVLFSKVVCITCTYFPKFPEKESSVFIYLRVQSLTYCTSVKQVFYLFIEGSSVVLGFTHFHYSAEMMMVISQAARES